MNMTTRLSWEEVDFQNLSQGFATIQEFEEHLLLWVDCLLDTAHTMEEKPSPDFLQDRRETLQIFYGYLLHRSKENALPFYRLSRLFSLDEGGFLVVALCYAQELDPDYGLIYGRMRGQEGVSPPDVHLVKELCWYFSPESSENLAQLRDPYSQISSLLLPHSRKGDLILPQRVLLWLQGQTSLCGALRKLCQILEKPETDLLVHQEKLEALTRIYLSLPPKLEGIPTTPRKSPLVVALCGEEGSGRRFLLQHLAKNEGFSILSLDLGKLADYSPPEQEAWFYQVQLELLFQNALLHLTNYNQEWGQSLWQSSLLDLPILFLSTTQGEIFPPLVSAVTLELPQLSINESLCLWQGQGVPFGEDVDLRQCATSYHLSPGQISQVCQQAWQNAKLFGGGVITQASLVKEVHHQSSGGLERLAKEVPVHYTWEDLILPESQKKVLQLAKNRLLFQGTVEETWGFQEKFPYGNGLSLLFCGASGTGKTMTAQVMAKETGRRLFTADLSQLTSKYIGESEKNVAELFDVAKDSNAILFFDEADALFAKRTQVENSNDRYANGTVAFLLQQMEQYPGMCILATNLMQNFDTAFLRRITYVLRFQKPDASLRLALWQSAFPQKAPVLPDLDLGFFAQELDLGGSNIKSVVRSAAYFAAQEASAIGTRHLLQALKLEYHKISPMSLPPCLAQMMESG